MRISNDDLFALITSSVVSDGPSRYSIDVYCEIADVVCDSGSYTQEKI